MTATTTLTLYREDDKMILAELQEGDVYSIPADVSIYEGSNEEFLSENNDYKTIEDYE